MKLYSKNRIPNYSEDQAAEYTRMLIQRKRLIYWLIVHYGKIYNAADQDDFFQEIMKDAWLAIPSYAPRPDATFDNWLTKVAKFSISGYKVKLYRTYSRITLIEDFLQTGYVSIRDVQDIGQLIDEADQSAKISDVIESLSEEERELVRYWYEGGSLRLKSLADGKNRGYYWKKILMIQTKVRRAIHGDDRKPRYRVPLNDPKYSKPIYQLTPEGRFVKSWPSIGEAERAGFNNIHRALSGKKATVRGYRWVYSLDTVHETTSKAPV